MVAEITRKWTRLLKGTPPRVLDLFSGAGGFSLGFRQAGCEIIGGVELDEDAAATHHLNFGHADHRDPGPIDITNTSAADLIARIAPGRTAGELVDILIGGPPCTAFTRVGRAKLASVAARENAFLSDPRAQLYQNYLDYVEYLRPVALVMENVPDLLNFGGDNVAEDIRERLLSLGYVAKYTILQAAGYGVPQLRSRLILVAWHQSTGLHPSFPTPTHAVDLPRGYINAQNVALKPHKQGTRLAIGWEEAPTGQDLLPAVSVSEAIGDLPVIKAHLTGALRKGARKLNEPSAGDSQAEPSQWAQTYSEIRPGRVTAHVIRSLSWRDYRLFRTMEPDEEYPTAWTRAHREYETWRDETENSGGTLSDYSTPFEAMFGLAHRTQETLRDPRKFASFDEATLSELVTQISKVQKGLRDSLPRNDLLGWPRTSDLPPTILEPWSAILVHLKSLRAGVFSSAFHAAAICCIRDLQRAHNARRVWISGAAALGFSGGSPACALHLPEVPDELQARFNAPTFGPNSEGTDPNVLNIAALRVHLLWLPLAASDAYATMALFIPPYNPAEFPNKWRKMNPHAPARTLMAHLGKDSYSHIHPDPAQARTLSVREAARLQSFPDSFQFCGSMNAGFRQIGNAVPPLLARAIAAELVAKIKEAADTDKLAAR